MDLSEIQEIVKGFAISASNLEASGFDGAELMSGHGALLQQSLSPWSNQRADEYGGSLENRLRFFNEVLTRSGRALIPNSCWGSGLAAARMKEVAGLPVIASQRINDPLLAEKILADAHADLIGMARPLICDPELPTKANEGRLDDIPEIDSRRRCSEPIDRIEEDPWRHAHLHAISGEVIDITGVNTVVMAAGNRACDELYNSLKGQARELHAVGDCLAPRKIPDAIREGRMVGGLL